MYTGVPNFYLSNFMYFNLSYFVAHLSRRLIGELILSIYMYRHPSSFRLSTFSNDISSEAVRRILSIFHI